MYVHLKSQHSGYPWKECLQLNYSTSFLDWTILLGGQINLRKQDQEGNWIASACYTDLVPLPETGFKKKYVCIYRDIQFTVRALQ